MVVVERKLTVQGIPGDVQALGMVGLTAVPDPGSGNVIPVPSHSLSVFLDNTAGARTLGNSQFPGQVAVIHGGGNNLPTVTPETGTWDGVNGIARFNGQCLVVVGMVNGGWRPSARDCTIALI